MIKPKSYKEKLKFLGIAVVMFTGIAYWLALQKTAVAYAAHQELEAKLDSIQHAPAAMGRLTAELQSYEKALSRFGPDSKSWEEQLLQGIAKVCQQHGATLIGFPAPLVEKQTSYLIYTREVKLEGSFKALVQALYALERMQAVGRITSVRYALEKDRKSKRTKLFAYLYFQHIKRESL